MRTNDETISEIKSFEAFIPFVYDDFLEPRSASDFAREWKGGPVHGTLTVGYGTTDKKKISLGLRIDEPTACQWLDEDLHQAEIDVTHLVLVPLNENQFGAMVSFVYNVGPGALEKSHMLKLLNDGDYDAVPRELMKFVNSKGVRMKGLVRRRAAEAKIWSEPVTLGAAEPSPHVGAGTTPDPVPDRPLITTKTITGIGAAGLGVIGNLCTQIADKLNALPDNIKYVTIAATVLTIVGLCIAAYGRFDVRNKEGV